MYADRAAIQPSILSIAADDGLDLYRNGRLWSLRLHERILGWRRPWRDSIHDGADTDVALTAGARSREKQFANDGPRLSWIASPTSGAR